MLRIMSVFGTFSRIRDANGFRGNDGCAIITALGRDALKNVSVDVRTVAREIVRYNRSVVPVVIDVEASGFGPESYPIEVGVVLADGQRYSRLISPFDDWTFWSPEAESVHGISRETLYQAGHSAHDVARELNQLLAGQVVYSDGWTVDKTWIDRLFYRCAIPCAFHVSPLESILTESQMMAWQQAICETRENLQVQRHRASTDALVIQTTYQNTRLA